MFKVISLVSLLVAAASCQAACPVADVSVIAHEGDPVGTVEKIGGIDMYLTGELKSDTALLYITDIYGIQLLQNKLLADSFGRAGYLVVAPDLFNGTPTPSNRDDPLADPASAVEFLAQRAPEDTDPLLDTAIQYLRETRGAAKVVATGYCFGGRYAFRVLAEGRGVNVAFAAHPSGLVDEEISAITGPVSVGAAETDSQMPPERRATIESLLLSLPQATTLSLYSGTSHGFGVRANISDPMQKFGKEQAFFQAVRWFQTWA